MQPAIRHATAWNVSLSLPRLTPLEASSISCRDASPPANPGAFSFPAALIPVGLYCSVDAMKEKLAEDRQIRPPRATS
jgi:hypothetical protein